MSQLWNAWGKSWNGSWAKTWGYVPEVPTGGGGVSLGNFNYRRRVEQVKKNPIKKVRQAAIEVAEYLDTGAFAQAAVASQAVNDALEVLRAYASPELMAVARDEALLAMTQKERAKILAQLEAWQQLLADDEEAITVLLLN
jgi:hypothetical protein